jgi:hypothetical protein
MERSEIPFAVRSIASCEREALFHLPVVLGRVTRWYVLYGYYIHGTRNLNGKCECVAPTSSIIVLHRTVRQTSTQPIENIRTQHGTIYPRTSIDQHIIERSSMETLTAERHPEGLIAPLINEDWETALTVILHSPHWTKIVDPTRRNMGFPLHVAIRWGAPVEVVTALLEAYPDASTIRNYNSNIPCHSACCAEYRLKE